MSICRACLTGIAGMLLAAASGHAAAAAEQPQRLRPNSPVERALEPRDVHRYTAALAAGEAYSIAVVQLGVDLTVELRAPEGTRLLTGDSVRQDHGAETLFCVVPDSGLFEIRVRASLPDAGQGRYAIALADGRKATPAEMEHARAERELRKLEADWLAALDRGDGVALYGLVTQDFVRIMPRDPLSPGVIPLLERDGVLELTRELRGALRDRTRKREIEGAVVRVYGDAALVAGSISQLVSHQGRERRSLLPFVHVWRKTAAGWWRLAVDHPIAGEPVPEARKVVPVAGAVQAAYAGRYEAQLGEPATIENAGDHLLYREGTTPDAPATALYPESETDYFAKDSDVQLTFVRDASGRITHAIRVSRGRASRWKRLP
jgi:ketosteroid isomerase-like protein